VGRQSFYLDPKRPLAATPADVSLDTIGKSLCAADFKRCKSVITITFDSIHDRDALWTELHQLRADTQARACR
jgi:hypothetical protein